jgi:hypothetical protein
MSWASEHARKYPGHRATTSANNPGYCLDCGERPLTYDLAQPLVPTSNVREAAERFQSAMDEVRRASRAIESEILRLEIYAREQAGDFEHNHLARAAYRDMADQLKALLGG